MSNPQPSTFLQQATDFPFPTSTSSSRSGGSLPTTNPNNSNNSNSNNNSSQQVIGSTPSTVLFFLALGVGVVIALLFIFFTLRYFIRSKYGVNITGFSRRNYYNYQQSQLSNTTNSSSNGSIVNEHTFAHIFTTTEVQDQLEYIRQHHYLRGEIIDRRLNGQMSTAARRNRRRRRGRRGRRGRYSKMKKLTAEEVELLFPKKTYHDWLNGGKERDVENREDILYEEPEDTTVSSDNNNDNDNNIGGSVAMVDDEDHDNHTLYTANTSKRVASPSNEIEMKQLNLVHSENDITDAKTDTINDDIHSLHFDSGSCAICLEMIEDEDVVRGLICGHVFHAECLDPWLTKRRACCPMCKRDYLFKRDYQANNNNNNSGSTAATTRTTDENTDQQQQSQQQENDDGEESDDSLDIDLDELRNDPALQLMLQELIPASERVRILLNDERYNHLNLPERGEEIAKQKYGGFFLKKLWWKIMGISKRDFFNWAVLKIVQEYRMEHPNDDTDTTTTTNNNNGENESTQDQAGETTTITTTTGEIDISDATRREMVDNRV
ncbi:hypothetical protein G210_4618 [Candida maltosa Xu316]|uniref:RING-type domain-containing protein n=1 Tax=Candida maltosa (strain Xu316) TaxID=1245528 RepID=M3K6A1_CANMX|nr:hypothetical protein G210_4618 [Candida maltosa Xu316]